MSKEFYRALGYFSLPEFYEGRCTSEDRLRAFRRIQKLKDE
jgi:hypothetical protein